MRGNVPRALLAIVLLAAAGSWRLTTSAQGVAEAERQLQKAILLETVDGNLQGAIDQYKKIVTQDGSNRATTAKALLRLAGCYEKLGQAEAEKAYRQLIADYADQTAEVAVAIDRLAALTTAPHSAPLVPALHLVWKGTDADSSGDVSPDGRLLAYTNWDTGDLAVRDLRSGQSRMVTNKGGKWNNDDHAFSARWSPDGKRLAYYWFRDDGDLHELRVIDVSGKNVRTLRSNPDRGVVPFGWLPDGSALVASELKQGYVTSIVRVSASDGAITGIRNISSVGTRRVRLSPDGSYIAFEEAADQNSLNMDVFIMPSSGGRAVAVVTGPYDDRLLDWTPDGRHVFFASNRSGSYDGWLVPVHEGKADGSPQLLRKDLGLIASIGFSPDGAFYFEPDVTAHDVLVADWSQETVKAVSAPVPATEHFAGSTRLPTWSPDGRSLAYVVDHGRDRPAETRLRIRNMRTGAERALAEVNGSVYSLAWSPDGSSLAICVRRGQAPSVCQIVSTESGEIVRRISTTHSQYGIFFFSWAPAGDVAYYVAGGGGLGTLLLRRDLRTEEDVPIYRGTPGVPHDFAVSPDGKQVAVVYGQRIMVIAATGGEPRELVAKAPGFRASLTLAWSRDGTYLYFGRHVEDAVKLYRVPLAGGAPEDLNFEVGEDLRFSPDGRRLAFTHSKGDTVGEVWVMENFLPAAKGAR